MAKVQIKTNANGTGILTIQAPNTDTDRTMNIPDSDGTMLLNIADDPTPQLGANLDTNGYNITGTGAIEIEGNISTDGIISGNITGNQAYYAKATEAISKGEVVMFNSAQGSNILIELADTQAVGFKPEYVMGIAAETMATNDFGIVVAFGKITGVDTDTYNDGDILYLDNSTAGGVTNTKPSASDGHTIIVAAVSNAASNGTIQVRLTHEPDTDEVPEGSTNLYYTDARVQAVSINNVVEDTTPQLGGDLDLNSNNITGTGNINITGTITYGTLNDGTTALTSTVEELNYLDGVTGITLGSANELLVVGGDGSSIVSDSTLAVDTSNNRLGINQSSPEVTLHMTGEGAQTSQIRMEQYNDSADAPDVRTRRYRGTIASPSAIQSGDYLFRSNHEYYNGSALIVGGQFAFDNTNNANRTQFTVAVTTDGTSVEASSNDDVQFKIDGNDSGAITFNNAYKFPTSDGSANQFLQTNGSGALTFATALQDITGESIKNLSDVYGSMSPTDGQLLTWDNANSRWSSADAPVSLPSQTGNSGYYLTTDGSSASWAATKLEILTRAGSTTNLSLSSGTTFGVLNRDGVTTTTISLSI